MELEERLLSLERTLSGLSGHEGWVIGKCRFELPPDRDTNSGDPKYEMETLRENRNLAEVRIWRNVGGDLLDVMLMRPVRERGNHGAVSNAAEEVKNSRRADGIDPAQERILKPEKSERFGNSAELKKNVYPEKSAQQNVFLVTREETDHYLHASGDKNPIHQGVDAIVPGFLMVNKIAGLLKTPERSPEKLQVRFFSPLPVGEAAELMISGQSEEKTTAEVHWNGVLILRIGAE